MGGYAFYIWTSFGITLFAMAASVIFIILQQKNLKKKLSKRIKRKRGDV
jgi:heme exporter protein D